MSRGFVIDLDYKKVAHAGSKAPSDAIAFLRTAGFEPVCICQTNTLKYLAFPFNFLSALTRIKEGDKVIFQFPVHSDSTFRMLLRLAEELGRKNVRRIALVHDIDFSRSFGPCSEQEELNRLSHFDLLIVHSPQMVRMLREHGCNVPCRVLGLFDYKVGKKNTIPRENGSRVVFAGNLSKSAFLADLPRIVSDKLSFNLYGIGGEHLPACPQIEYRGVFQPDDLSALDGNWGLVWDGDNIEDCSGQFGEYLKVNSPHKASLYLCAGLPLIVPEGSAVADIVRTESLGIVTKSLTSLDLASVTDEEYKHMLVAVDAYAEGLRSGRNLLSALKGQDF